jgi:peptide deformylase
MILEILTEPNPVLRQKSRPVEPADFKDPKFEQSILNLIETMKSRDGVGMAAPQAGMPLRFCVITKEYSEDKIKDIVLINPVWTKKSILRSSDEEGCLSVPNVFGRVLRYKKIRVKAVDENGKSVNFEAKNFLARIIQHEVDHLDGILFIDKAKNLYRVDKKL